MLFESRCYSVGDLCAFGVAFSPLCISSVSHIQLKGSASFPLKSRYAQNRDGFSAHMSLKVENNKNVKLLKKAKSIYQYVS